MTMKVNSVGQHTNKKSRTKRGMSKKRKKQIGLGTAGGTVLVLGTGAYAYQQHSATANKENGEQAKASSQETDSYSFDDGKNGKNSKKTKSNLDDILKASSGSNKSSTIDDILGSNKNKSEDAGDILSGSHGSTDGAGYKQVLEADNIVAKLRGSGNSSSGNGRSTGTSPNGNSGAVTNGSNAPIVRLSGDTKAKGDSDVAIKSIPNRNGTGSAVVEQPTAADKGTQGGGAGETTPPAQEPDDGTQGGGTTTPSESNIANSNVTYTRLVKRIDANGQVVYDRNVVDGISTKGVTSGMDDMSFSYETTDGSAPKSNAQGNLQLPNNFTIDGGHGFTLSAPSEYTPQADSTHVGTSTLNYFVGNNANDGENAQVSKTVTVQYKKSATTV